MQITEITREDVIKNCEKYYNNKQHFLIRRKYTNGLTSEYISSRMSFKNGKWEITGYGFHSGEDDWCGTIDLDDDTIQHIYLCELEKETANKILKGLIDGIEFDVLFEKFVVTNPLDYYLYKHVRKEISALLTPEERKKMKADGILYNN